MDTTKPGIEDVELVRKAKDGGVWVNLIDRIADLFGRDETTRSQRTHVAKVILTDSQLTLLEFIDNRPHLFIYNLDQFKIAQEYGKDFIVLFDTENIIVGKEMGDCLIKVEQNGEFVEVGATFDEIEEAGRSVLQNVELLVSGPRIGDNFNWPYRFLPR